MSKTIEECFKEAGSKFPFRARCAKWPRDEFFHCVNRSPRGQWIGWCENGDSHIWENLDEKRWELYVEPKAKKKLYPYLCPGLSSSYVLRYYHYGQSPGEAVPHPSLSLIEIDE